jgi:hypothetical protein
MMSRAGDIRCVECALVDNLRAGAELNLLSAPYNTTGTMNRTIIAINTRAMKPFTVTDSENHTNESGDAVTARKLRRKLQVANGTDVLPASGLPHSQRDDPDKGTSYGWCDTAHCPHAVLSHPCLHPCSSSLRYDRSKL